MKVFVVVGAVALGLGLATSASAMNLLQPGMLTMMQQGGQEHGVQTGRTLPCSTSGCPSAYFGQAWSPAQAEQGHWSRRSPRAKRVW